MYRNVLACCLPTLRKVSSNREAIQQAKRRQAKRALRLESLEVRSLMAGQVFQQIPVELTNLEQLSLELVNRARANPQAEATRFGIGLNDGLASPNLITASPKQPLTPESRLALSARRH